MGEVITFPTPKKRDREVFHDEPAKVIVLPVLRVEQGLKKANLPALIRGGPPCRS